MGALATFIRITEPTPKPAPVNRELVQAMCLLAIILLLVLILVVLVKVAIEAMA